MTALQTQVARHQVRIDMEPFHQWALPDGTSWTEFYRIGDGYLLRFPALADFEVSSDGSTVTCFPAPETPPGTSQHLYLNQVLPLVQSRQGRLVFHASAIEIDGMAIAFVATSGRGKSTLAASFALAGHRFLTDDGLVLQPAESGYQVMPSHPSIRLWEDSEAALMAPDAPAAPSAHYTAKARFLAGKDLLFCDGARPLRRVYFLGEGSHSDVVFRHLSGREALVGWTRHSFLLDVEEKSRLADHFKQIAWLANEPIHYGLDYPRDFAELERVRQAIVAHART